MFKPFLTSFSFFFTKSLEHSSDLYELTRDLTGKTGKKEEDPVEVWERILGERGEEGVVLGFFSSMSTLKTTFCPQSAEI